HRMVRVAFDLDRATLAGLDEDAAAGRALHAGARIPGRHAGHLVVRGDEVRDELVGRRLRAARGGAGPADADEHEELAAGTRAPPGRSPSTWSASGSRGAR